MTSLPRVVTLRDSPHLLAALKSDKSAWESLSAILSRSSRATIGQMSSHVSETQLDQRPANSKFAAPCMAKIPHALKEIPRWLLWRAEGGQGEKPRKVPYDPSMLNSRASSTDENTWGSFDLAEAAFDEGGYTGIGVVLNGDGLVGIDMDNCVVDGAPMPGAVSVFRELGVEYIEVSPSGTGLRGFGYAGGLPTGCKGKYKGFDLELYSNGRYLTVTGRPLAAGPLVKLRGFEQLAERIRSDQRLTQRDGGMIQPATDERHAVLLNQVLSGDIYHDSLRDLAASLIATGMNEGAAVNHLRAVMKNAGSPHDSRWSTRMADIPKLVASASRKFKPSSGTPAGGHVHAERRYKILTPEDLTRSAHVKWLIQGLCPRVGLVALYGPSGSGKSFLALDMAISIAGGAGEWYGHRVTHRPVTYCVLEGEAGMGKRVSAWSQHHDRPVPDSLRFVTQPINVSDPDDITQLAGCINDVGVNCGLIVLDTLNRAAPNSDENSSKDMGAIIAGAKRLQELTGGVVMFIHHTGKVVENGMRGHSSLFAAMDAVIGVSNSKGAFWSVVKSKDDVTGAVHSFRLDPVVVGIDEEGEDVTSCVAVPTAPPFAVRKSKRLGQHQETAYTVLLGLLEKEGPAGREIHIDLAVQAVADQIEVGPRHKRLRAKEAIEALVLKGLARTEGDSISLCSAGISR